MLTSVRRAIALLSILFLFQVLSSTLFAQAAGNSGTIRGTVTDPTGAVVPGATVSVENVVSGYKRTATTDSGGKYQFTNLPFNPYHMTVSGSGFASYAQDAQVQSVVPVTTNISLQIEGASTSVTVEGAGDLLETDSTAHTDIDRNMINELPLESQSSSLSSLVTLSSPGIAADSNGLFHGLGDHAENSFSVDGQPITDQQSKVFSNQVPVSSIQSIEVIAGAPPAEYGDKTSLVINVTTRSGQGVTKPTGSLTTSYGSFGTVNGGFDIAYGKQKWGNFVSVDGLNTGRFLDPPEFKVMHDKGNEQNLFDRVDYQFSAADSVHLNLNYSRSWFQNPNSYDQQFHSGIPNPVTGKALGATDQRSKIGTFNIAPTWTHLIGGNAVFNFGTFVRRDDYNYYPSANPFADFSPDLQSETVGQNRTLTNAGVRGSISSVKGIHNIKGGFTYQQTFLNENDSIGVVDPGVLAGIGAANGCLAPNGTPTGPPCSDVAPFDLTNGGGLFHFNGHTDVKELSVYLQDTITKGNWSFNLGLRGDEYNGLASGRHARQAEPRLGVAYNIVPSNTVLRLSYARSLETPFNENLVIASAGCNYPFLADIIPPPGVACKTGPITPGFRNEFHTGLQQAFGKHLVVDGEYLWKYTHNGYDFGVVAATPITFPIEWHNSKISGFTLRANVPSYHGFSALVVMSSVAARFFLPQVAGVPIIPPSTGVFRIDHDERFNQTAHLQYQPSARMPWIGFNWRYDSGLVSGAVPCMAATATCFASTSAADGGGANIPSGQVALVNAISGAPLSGDQQFQAGLTCNGKLTAPTPFSPGLATCPAAGLGSIYVKVPLPGKENDDHNPQRIQPRSLFDLSLGHDDIFHGDKYKTSIRVSAINLTNKEALYNFLSTFSGTHYVTPRALTAEIGLHF